MPNMCLLTMDLQNGIAGRFEDNDYLARVATAQTAARDAGVPVVHVVVQFRPGYPEVSDHNMMFTRISSRGALLEDQSSATICPQVAAAEGEVVVAKRRVSAFSGSDLGVVLRTLEARHLILAGVATSGVVLSTLREAADLDYQLTVLTDGCLDSDEEVHRVLTSKVFPIQATVTTVAEWKRALAG